MLIVTFSGGGAANLSLTYYVFDKDTGERLTLNDISNDKDNIFFISQ